MEDNLFSEDVVKAFISSSNEYNENKENMILVLESKKKEERKTIAKVFLAYNIIKFSLWKRGFFPLFFHFTRFSSVAIAAIFVYLSEKNFEMKLEKYGLLSYYSYMNKNAQELKQISVDNEFIKQLKQNY